MLKRLSHKDVVFVKAPAAAVLTAISLCAGAANMTAPTPPTDPEFREEWFAPQDDAISRTLIYSGRFTSPETVRELYEKNSYRPLWSAQKADDVWMTQFIAALEGLTWDALPRWRYHTDNIKRLHDAGDRDAVLDLMITDALVTAANDLGGQLVPETALGRRWKLRSADIDAAALVTQLRFGGTANQLFDALRPNHPQYVRLRDAYRRTLGEYRVVTLPADIKLQTGDQGPHVLSLMQRLEAEGLLTVTSEDRSEAAFDARVTEAVRDFQKMRGLKVDGIVGRGTIAALNRDPESIARTIALNLQRWRTTPRDFPDTHILVNSASFEMSLVEDGKAVLGMPVVVGKRSRQTPSFADSMNEVVLNPDWNIPTRIANEEILPRLREDRTYADRLGLRALDGNQPVDWNLIDDVQLQAGEFPYRLQQVGGDNNALGRYKFLFPNEYLVYLHDTPYKTLFNEETRAFSHGCVRLQEPERLAQHLLAKRGVSERQIAEIVQSGKRRSFTLKEPLPVYLMYLTSWVRDDGTLELYPDHYRMDRMLSEELIAVSTDPGDSATILALAEELDPNSTLLIR